MLLFQNFPLTLTGSPLGHTRNDQIAHAKSRQRWGLGMGCVRSLYGQMAAFAKETLSADRIATTLFVLISLALLVQVKVCAGDMNWNVKNIQKNISITGR